MSFQVPKQARKRFGQHFLIDEQVLQRILSSVNPQPDQHIIEIGAGHGVLTLPLADSGCQITAIEIDRDLHRQLHTHQVSYANLYLIRADALHYDFSAILSSPCRIVGNLPYNIAIPLIERLFDTPNIQDMHLLVQQEIAHRLLAVPGHHHYGRLSLLCSMSARGEVLFTVPPQAFSPPPQVISSFIRLLPIKQPSLSMPRRQLLKDVIRNAFMRPHRYLRHNLKDHTDSLSRLNMAHKRAVDLNLQDFIDLTDHIAHEKRE